MRYKLQTRHWSIHNTQIQSNYCCLYYFCFQQRFFLFFFAFQLEGFFVFKFIQTAPLEKRNCARCRLRALPVTCQFVRQRADLSHFYSSIFHHTGYRDHVIKPLFSWPQPHCNNLLVMTLIRTRPEWLIIRNNCSCKVKLKIKYCVLMYCA